MSRTVIVEAVSDELRHAAYRFRYDVYVIQMQRHQNHADHTNRTVTEPQDDGGRVFVALRDGIVIGTIRSNRASEPTMSYYLKLYDLPRFEFADLSTIQITTKLMIDPGYARSGLAPRLIASYAAAGYVSGVTVDFIDCNKHLVPFFQRLGYFSYCGWRFHKEYGSVRPMFFPVDTIGNLRQLGSVLAVPAARILADNHYGGYDLIRRFATDGTPPTVPEATDRQLVPA